MTSLLRVLALVVAVTAAGVVLSSVVELAASPPAPSSPTEEGASAETIAPTAAPTLRTTPSPTPRPARTPKPSPKPEPAPDPKRVPPTRPLSGVTIALDPGHQLGNSRFPRETNALVPAGGFEKPCNTTGTATDGGVAEATVNFQLAEATRQRLEGLGARVVMTRTSNSMRRWGPCVDDRGEFGERVGARLMVSLHADGSTAAANGFHVIAPRDRAPWTDDIAGPSLGLARALRDSLTEAGIPRADYGAMDAGLIQRDDLGTLNLSDVPVAMVEIGNMRNSGDAQRMTSVDGQARYAGAVVQGIRMFLRR